MFGCCEKALISASLLAASLCCAAPASAQSAEEMDILQMIYRDKDLVVTATRSAKPVSQVAENVTVITAEEIEAINAHTLTDVLYHVTGVQIDIQGGPGSITNAYVQGSDPRHVQVMVDGVSLNNLADNFADIGAFPVQQIERVEIVKGPASSAWGSALGGVINIITKSADPKRSFGGTVSASIGERGTGDFRAAASGTAGRLGYYLYGGGLTSDGLTRNTLADAGNFYGKLQLHASEQLQLQYTLGYTRGSRGAGEASAFDLSFKNNVEYLFSTLALNYTITDHLELNLSGRSLKQHANFLSTQLSTGLEQESNSDETTIGGSAKLNWRSGMHNLMVGADYDDGELESEAIKDGKQDREKWALFANDTMTLGDFSLTPGIRYDQTGTNGDFLSPSLGVTYVPVEHTILRAYVARGFNIPSLGSTFGAGEVFFSVANPDLKVEKVWSYAVGIESSVLKYLWGKATGFSHDIRDVIATEQRADGTFMSVNSGKQRRQGVELELKTLPLFNTSLLAGYTFVDAEDRETGERIADIPRYTYDVGLDYNDNDSFKGALRGHYIWWNASAEQNGRYNAMIWDLNLTRKVVSKGRMAVEAFFTARNIFNGSQYLNGFFTNPGRWFEGGLRVKF
ncbi:MAG: TonB-dependent receptor [Geobacteraceae bacterium]|nr:TonB-dependent receptor [Geobacteraceae bacterium]